jgi:hypothetical protein
VSSFTLIPDPFTMVQFDAERVKELMAECAATVGLDTGVDVTLEVDEALPLPLTGSMADVRDGAVRLWCSGGTLEHTQYQGKMSEPIARAELAGMLLRAKDRLGGGFEAAPPDAELSDRARAVWDVYVDGRLERLGGFDVREPRRRYTYRLYAGFNDVADAAYLQLRSADALTWADIEATAQRLDAADPREARKRSVRRPSLRMG